MTNSQEHPLKKYPEKDKVAYLCLVAFIAKADGTVSNDEISKIRELCKQAELSAEGMGKVIAFAEHPNAENLQSYANMISSSDLKFTLVTDMFFLGYADNVLSDNEIAEIKKIATKLGIKDEQVQAIRKYVEAVLKASNAKGVDLKELGTDVAGSLAAVGVPLGAVAVSGSVFGLSAAGITSGLAALGLGFGMATGIGTVAVLGVGTYYGVKWLGKKLFG